MSVQGPTTVFRHTFTVAESAVDLNNHVNNVVYVQWMQDVAVMHSDTVNGTQATHAAGGSWVARAHAIEYLSPAFAGEEVTALTWVVDFRRVRSRRRYRFVRSGDGTVLARGETDWVFVDAATGRPRRIPDNVSRCYPLVPDGPETKGG